MLNLLLPVLAWVPGPWELVLILAVLLLLFGGKKLPELARSMGISITQFKRGLKDADKLPEGDGDGGSESEPK